MATLIAGGLLIVSRINLVSLSVGVQVMNDLCLPIVGFTGFLYLLARRLRRSLTDCRACMPPWWQSSSAAPRWFGVYSAVADCGARA